MHNIIRQTIPHVDDSVSKNFMQILSCTTFYSRKSLPLVNIVAVAKFGAATYMSYLPANILYVVLGGTEQIWFTAHPPHLSNPPSSSLHLSTPSFREPEIFRCFHRYSKCRTRILVHFRLEESAVYWQSQQSQCTLRIGPKSGITFLSSFTSMK